MERCEGCARELASPWRYCIYCGRPLRRAAPPATETLTPAPVAAPAPAPAPEPEPALVPAGLPRPIAGSALMPEVTAVLFDRAPAGAAAPAREPLSDLLHAPAPDSPLDPIPGAIRPDPAPDDTPSRFDTPFWVGLTLAVVGAALIVYAAIQIYASYA